MLDYKTVSGRIFDIQRYSIHDGMGIRTIVFLKGCALRCRWCCNPESQSYDVETMSISGKNKTVGRDTTVGEVLDIVKRDMPYYLRSNGGLTLSGGECLLQPEFSKALLQGAKELGINTAIESMGYAKFEVIETILPYLDAYLMDIKHMNPEKHREWTGRENTLMVQNAMKIAQSRQTCLIIRVPIVPGFNDTDEEVLAIARYTDTLLGVEQIHLLPYHKFGMGKYIGLGRTYPMGEVLSPSDEKMQHFKELIQKSTSLRCQIGG